MNQVNLEKTILDSLRRAREELYDNGAAQPMVSRLERWAQQPVESGAASAFAIAMVLHDADDLTVGHNRDDLRSWLLEQANLAVSLLSIDPDTAFI